MAVPPSPNFAFLAHHDPRLVVFASQAERLFADDPSACLAKLRLFGEILAQRAAARVGVLGTPGDSQIDLLARLAQRGALDATSRQLFHDLRRTGNEAAHRGTGDHGEALHQLKMARQLAVWFQRAFGNDRKFDPGPFVPPPGPSEERFAAVTAELEALRALVAKSAIDRDAANAAAEEEGRKRQSAEERAAQQAEERALWEALAQESEAKRATELAAALAAVEAKHAAELAALQAAALAAPKVELQKTVEQVAQAGGRIQLDEAATRRIIDAQLRDAQWEADTATLAYGKGTRPVKGRNLAIAEWPTKSGEADYVLFAGLVPVGVVEAKREGKDIPGDIEQAKRYSRDFKPAPEMVSAGGPWGDLRIPFLYATNGRPFLRQLRTASGIWFLDGRRKENHPDALDGWHTPAGLLEMLKQDVDAANAALKAEPTDKLAFLRDYQRDAIRAVETAIAGEQRNCLVAMATGTGKTKTCIALVYRLLKAKRFRRVLFVVDRTSLGEQAGDAFKETKLENLETFSQIFNMTELGELEPAPETRLQIATIQAMVRRLDDEDGDKRPAVDQYDCIVVDECHRGYLLDREMSDAQMSFRSEEDFISSYRRVLDHFDAVKIGLTATPALHTTEIFGPPVFSYTYRQAVIDGNLVDHEPPYNIVTKLGKDGITWTAGEEMQVLDRSRKQIDRVMVPDEITLEIDTFNRRVITEGFNRAVCGELAKHIDPRDDLKTLVFCVDDAHANLVVTLLKKAFDEQYGPIDDDAVQKITGSVDKPLLAIKHFKNERLPNVAVTVDLLTTGIDVPSIATLVFLRRIRSRILYEQMIGRATRLHPAKEAFRIFDAVALYDAMKSHSDMKPVVPNPSITFAALAEAIVAAKDDDVRDELVDELVAKLQRKKRALKGDDALEGFEAVAGAGPAELAATLKRATGEEVARWLEAHPAFAGYLDQTKAAHAGYIVSEHVDEVREITRGYGGADKPKDYLDAFAAYLRTHMNEIPALLVVTQRPRDLTRKELRALKLALDAAGYSEANLRTAWREMTNQDIAASIIGHVRRAALGDPLLPYGERVDRAIRKIAASRPWTAPQRKWLDKLGNQLKAETVVDREAFDQGLLKAEGGFARFDKIFEGKLGPLLGEIHEAVWRDVS